MGLRQPTEAASEFAARRPDFVLEEPKWRFNESELDRTITAWSLAQTGRMTAASYRRADNQAAEQAASSLAGRAHPKHR
jgi:hypothetical protein